jgi:F0F1-type ATP synthase gamma subunit
MSAINELNDQLAQTQTAQFVATMLRDISATKLQSIRAQFELNEAYYTELHQLVDLVQTYARNHSEVPSETTKQPRRIYVALTSNKRFYGTINREVVELLHKQLTGNKAATGLVYGLTGKQLLQQSPLLERMQFVQYERDEPTDTEMYETIVATREYDEVFVVHPTYFNSFTQGAAVTDLTHVPSLFVEPIETPLEYLFEPEIPDILDFFATQIRLVLFQRVMLETRLALTGARLMKMQRARERAGELLVEQRRRIHKEMNTVAGMRLLETFTGFQKHDAV